MRNSASSSAASVADADATTKTKATCCSKAGLKRGPWAPEEDELLTNYIKKEGPGQWRTLPKRAGLSRCGKSCRLRWMNYLRPSIKRGQIAPDEEDLILRLHRLLGNRWSLIAGRIPGRTDNEIKNYWNSHLSKKLISQGIDPRTHKPLKNDHPVGDNQHLLIKASSSKEDQRASFGYDHIPAASLEETNGSNPSHFIGNKGYEYFHNTSVDQYFHSVDINASHGHTSSLNFDTETEARYDQLGLNDEGDGDIDQCYSEDAFSSFLNSIINDDPLVSQHQMQQQESNGIASRPDPLLSFPKTTSTFDTD